MNRRTFAAQLAVGGGHGLVGFSRGIRVLSIVSHDASTGSSIALRSFFTAYRSRLFVVSRLLPVTLAI
jgi:hypothetical protein